MTLRRIQSRLTRLTKDVGKSIIRRSIAHPVLRRAFTSNYNSGLLALGECNHYLFPARFVTVDIGDADFSMRFANGLKLPFDDSSQSVVYAAHVLEHLSDELGGVLSEVHRVLRPGGGFRIEVPDAAILLHAYQTGDRTVLDHFRNRRAYLCEDHGFDERYLEDQITVVGEIASYNLPEQKLIHVPVYASREEVDAAIGEGGIDALEALATRKSTPQQRSSGGHNSALYWERLRDAVLAAGFSRVERMSRRSTIIDGLELGNGPGTIWNRVRENRRREFYSLYVDAIK